MEREHGSLIRGGARRGPARSKADREDSGARYGLFASLIDGMETLPRALAAALPAGSLRLEDGRPADHPARAGRPLAGRAARRPADRGRRA